MSALINPRYYPMIPNLVSECFVLYSTNFHILSFFVDWATSYMEIVIVRFKKSLVSPTVSRNLYLKSQAITNIKFDIPFFFLCQRSQKAKKQKSQFLFSFLFSYFWINSPLAGSNLLRPIWFLQYPHWTLYTVDCTHVLEQPGMNIFSYVIPGMNIFINLDDQFF